MTQTPFPNQPPPYEGRNLYRHDAMLRSAVQHEGAGWAEPALDAWGETLGRAETFALAEAANRFPPQLRAFDRAGEPIDAVEFHPAWHELMRLAARAGEHASPWSDPRPGAQVARGAMYVLHGQVENGTQCPLTMTYASVPALTKAGRDVPGLLDVWLPRVLAHDYDPRPRPIRDKRAALIGMGMTERQGGSDLRSNRSTAGRADDGAYRLTGHKWFFSAPQCDAHLVLAQAPQGLTSFFLPRFLDDGARNAVRLVRLKDKLGNRSNASSEVEFAGALAWRLGEEGRGVATILEMVQHTRLDCVLGTAGMMRGALGWALHHAAHRVAFGRRLFDQPLMLNVLADLALEVEAAIVIALRLARAFEAPEGSRDAALARVATPAAKFWLCKRGPALAAEAMEVLGGNGYVEENPLPRLYREMPVNSIWEGSGNVVALDVLRALRREPGAAEALRSELALARGHNDDYDAFLRQLDATLAELPDDPASGRRIAQAIALALQATLLLRRAPSFVANAFCRSRLAPSAFGGGAFGLHPSTADTSSIALRALGE